MTKHLRIATWNLERPGWKSPRVQPQLETIAAIDADIWILTETHAAIKLDPPYNCVESPPQKLRRKGEQTTAIWTRCKVLRNIPTFTDRPDERDPQCPTYAVGRPAMSPAACAEIETPLGPLLVYGTIIAHFGDKGREVTSSYGDEQYKAIHAHRDDWARLRNSRPMCVAGDFNTTLNGRSWEPKDARPKLEAALVTNDLHCVTNTFAYCIDHICLTPEWAERVIHREQWEIPLRDGKKITDHKATSVDLRLD